MNDKVLIESGILIEQCEWQAANLESMLKTLKDLQSESTGFCRVGQEEFQEWQAKCKDLAEQINKLMLTLEGV